MDGVNGSGYWNRAVRSAWEVILVNSIATTPYSHLHIEFLWTRFRRSNEGYNDSYYHCQAASCAQEAIFMTFRRGLVAPSGPSYELCIEGHLLDLNSEYSIFPYMEHEEGLN